LGGLDIVGELSITLFYISFCFWQQTVILRSSTKLFAGVNGQSMVLVGWYSYQTATTCPLFCSGGTHNKGEAI
jgi:hypothetical protein